MTTTSIAAPLNLIVRFASEVTALVALGFWGYHLGNGSLLSILLAAAMPLAMATVWGAVIAPRASMRASDPVRLLVELGIFAIATTGVAVVAGPLLATGFAFVVSANIALMFAFRQRLTA